MESKTLKGIQVLSKIGKILSLIVFICSIVGAVGCVLGILGMYFGNSASLKFGGVTIHSLIEEKSNLSVGTIYYSMVAAILACISEIILAKMYHNYFKQELKDGTPFTFDGAKKMLRLGIVTLVVSVVTSILIGITFKIFTSFMNDVTDEGFKFASNFGIGLAFIIVSFICRLGAEQAGNSVAEKKVD